MNLTAAIDLIKGFEGFSPTPYQDSGGVWSQGYGTTEGITADSRPISQDEATALLIADLQPIADAVTNSVTYPINDNQFNALCSFVYNVGITAFENSTLLKLLNNGNIEGAADAFLNWNHVNGMVVKGLTNRRMAERSLFLQPVSEEA